MIKINNLTKKYSRGKEVISGLNLEFGEVGLNIICGKSGCGKTTLINILGAMDREFSGEVVVDGLNLLSANYTEIADYRNFTSAFVFQKNSLFEYLTVKENLELCLNIQNNESSISEALERVGLKGFENKKVRALSGGEKQRVAIARALIKDCKIVFADEPTSALDSKNAHKIFQLFKELSKDKLVIVVTHDLKKATMYADRLVRLVDGNIEEDIMYHERKESAKVLEERKSKPFSLMPIFRHHLKTGLVINLFVMILLIVGLSITNIAIEQKKIKKEYDNFGTDKYTFNVDRAIQTQIDNDIDTYKIVKRGNADNPYYYIENAYAYDYNLSEGDYVLLNGNIPHKYDVYEGSNDIEFERLIIPGISSETLKSYVSGGMYYYWKVVKPTNFVAYTYDKDNHYDLVAGRLPQNDNEILITDTVADMYLRKRAYSPGSAYRPYYSDYIVNYNDLLYDNYTVYYDPAYAAIYNLDEDQPITLSNVDNFKIWDTYGSFIGNVSGTETYYLYNEIGYTVVGIINTGILDYYTYNYNEGRYYLLDNFESQTGSETFMNSLHYQPSGYVVLPKPLACTNENQNKQDPYKINGVEVNDKSLNPYIAAFSGSKDYTEAGFAGGDDNLIIDKDNRILAKSTSELSLLDNEIIISVNFAQIAFPEARITQNTAALRYSNIDGKTVKLTFDVGGEIVEKKFKVVGICKNFAGDFYVSDNVFKELYITQKGTSPTLSVNLKGENLASRKHLMKLLYELGYCLVPEENMPGAYLEFVENKGEMIAEVDFEGLASLYPYYTTEDEGSKRYFVVDGVRFGYISGEYVYMTSSVIRQISLDDSYYESKGNISPYYLYSDYYNSNIDGCNTSSDKGNSILEVIDSLYRFFLGVAVILAIGFIVLKEVRQSESITKLSMLGVRNKDLLSLSLLTYIPMGIMIIGSAILLSFGLTHLVNSLYSYRFENTLMNASLADVALLDSKGNPIIIETVVNRIRLMFTSTSIWICIIGGATITLITLVSSMIVTLKSRK